MKTPEVVDWARAGTEPRRVPNRSGDIGLRQRHRFVQRSSEGEVCGDLGRKCAAGSMRVAPGDAFCGVLGENVSVVDKVGDRLGRASGGGVVPDGWNVTASDHHINRPESKDAPGCLALVLFVADRYAGENFCFWD